MVHTKLTCFATFIPGKERVWGETVCGGREGRRGGKDRKALPHQMPGYISLTTSMGLGQERGSTVPFPPLMRVMIS